MIQHAAQINRTLKGLAVIAQNHSPLLSLFAKNWPLIGVAGAALGTRYYRQWKAGKLEFWPSVQDAGVVISPLVGLFILQKIAEEKHEVCKANGAPAPTVPGPAVQVLGRLA